MSINIKYNRQLLTTMQCVRGLLYYRYPVYHQILSTSQIGLGVHLQSLLCKLQKTRDIPYAHTCTYF